MSESVLKKQAVFLDRDGVINAVVFRGEKLSAPYSKEEFEILPGVQDAVQRLKHRGFLCIVVTNQPEIGRGDMKEEVLREMHNLMQEELEIDAVYVCPHARDGECVCRKPAPGSLVRAAHEFGIDLRGSYMIGDRWRDMDAGRAAGCFTIHIPTKATEVDVHRQKIVNADSIAKNLHEAVDLVVRHQLDMLH